MKLKHKELTNCYIKIFLASFILIIVGMTLFLSDIYTYNEYKFNQIFHSSFDSTFKITFQEDDLIDEDKKEALVKELNHIPGVLGNGTIIYGGTYWECLDELYEEQRKLLKESGKDVTNIGATIIKNTIVPGGVWMGQSCH